MARHLFESFDDLSNRADDAEEPWLAPKRLMSNTAQQPQRASVRFLLRPDAEEPWLTPKRLMSNAAQQLADDLVHDRAAYIGQSIVSAMVRVG